LVVTEPVLSLFALHSGFDIDVRESELVWRRVCLDELQGNADKERLLAIGDLPKASEIAECRL
jgi:hypothetical protein